MTEDRASPPRAEVTGVTLGRNDRADRSPVKYLLLAYFIAGAVMLLPLLWASVPPLVDYPNHLARMAILAHAGNPAVVANYVPHWHLLPNLAMDLIVPPLTHLMPLEVAGRVFIAATMCLLVIGTVLLRRAIYGSVGAWPLCSFFFTYNAVLWWGFLNYLFALGVAIICFAGWVGSDRWPPSRRALAFAVAASGLFILHLFALGVFGLLVISFELGVVFRTRNFSRAKRDAIVVFGMLIPAGLMWLISVRQGGPTYITYGGLQDRIVAFLSPVLFNHNPDGFDVTLCIVLIGLLSVGFYRRIISIAPSMLAPIIALLIGSALMPEWVQGSWAASFRLPIVVPFVLIASVRLHSGRKVAMRAIIAVAVVLLCVRAWAVSEAWYKLDSQYSEFRSALQTVPVGVRLFTVHSFATTSVQRIPYVPQAIESLDWTSYLHLSALAIIDRGAFTPALFTDWYPVTASAKNRALSRIMSLVIPGDLDKLAEINPAEQAALPRNILDEPPCCLDWANTYQFVVWLDLGRPPVNLPKHLEPWAAGTFFHIYRVVP